MRSLQWACVLCYGLPITSAAASPPTASALGCDGGGCQAPNNVSPSARPPPFSSPLPFHLFFLPAANSFPFLWPGASFIPMVVEEEGSVHPNSLTPTPTFPPPADLQQTGLGPHPPPQSIPFKVPFFLSCFFFQPGPRRLVRV